MMKQVKFTMPLRMLALICGLILSATAFAQQITVNGNVVDATGEPIIGATVRVAGQQGGVVTDFDGNFQIKANSGATITVSFVGYQEAQVAAAPRVNIVLQDDAQLLKDVVVIGYGTVKKSDATGSVMSVEADQLTKGLSTSPADLLQGKTPGVVITNNGGAPGAGSTIRIRGGSSLSASNNPLIVIDGLPISSTGISGQSDVLSTINPNDIESFSILKDASATAIYGSRASNGVIVITTKKGASGKPKVSIDMTGSFQNVAKYTDVMNAAQFTDFLNSYIARNSALDGDVVRAASLLGADTDWQKEIYRTAWTEELNASVTGSVAGPKTGTFNGMPYRVSAGYLNNDGTLKETNMRRGTMAINLTPKLLDERLTVNLNAKGVLTKNNFGDTGAIGAAVQYAPTLPVRSDNGINGYYAWLNSDGSSNTMSTLNPVAQIAATDNTANVKRFVGNAQFDYKFKFLEGLRANLNLGLDVWSSDGTNAIAQGSEKSFHDTSENGAGSITEYGQTRRDQTLEFYLAYANELPKLSSRFDVLAGYSWQHFFNSTSSTKYSYDKSTVINNYPGKTESYLVSFYGRLNYTLMDRYLLTFTLREDGTSRFQNNKWGLFPSLALAWRISEEPILRDIDALSNLKLRLGWGQTGQQEINAGDYPSLATYHTNLTGSYYMFGNQQIIPISPKAYDKNLKWETTTTYNIGLDYGFLNNRINGSIDAYYRKTTDLLNYAPVALGSNLNNYVSSNVGDLENKGIEFALNVVPIEQKDLHWEVGFNVAYNQNKITKLTANDDPTYVGVQTGRISGGTGNWVQIHQVDHPASSFFVLEQVYDKDGNPIEGAYVDRNGDGKIDDSDRYVYKNPAADWTLGINTTLTYKAWTLSLAGRANLGNYVYNNVASNNELMTDLWTNSFSRNMLTTAVESDFLKVAQYRSDYYVHNASFFKLDKITLAYQATKWLRVHATAQNVFTITKYKGVDPEVFGGIDNNLYPRSRTFLFGASLNF